MTEDFVTFESAKKLKDKGFDKPCMNAINRFGCTYANGWCEYLDDCTGEFITQDDLKEGDYLLPTINQILKWLREEKEIDIILYPIFLYNENNREREYGIEIYAPQLNKPVHLDYFKNWEKGATVGIEYVLDNLI